MPSSGGPCCPEDIPCIRGGVRSGAGSVTYLYLYYDVLNALLEDIGESNVKAFLGVSP